MFRLSYDYTNTSPRDINDFFLNSTYNEESAAEFFASRTGPLTGKPSGAVVFPSLRQLMIPAQESCELSQWETTFHLHMITSQR